MQSSSCQTWSSRRSETEERSPPKPTSHQQLTTPPVVTPSNEFDEFEFPPNSITTSEPYTARITQPSITNVGDPTEPGLSRGEVADAPGERGPRGQQLSPPPSPALAGRPQPFSTGQTDTESESDPETDDDDEPFHGFKPCESQGRPKRNTKKPDRLQYNTFSARTV